MSESPAVNDQHLAEVFSEHRRELRNFLQGRLKCSHTADDLTQETYLRLVRTATTPVQDWRAFIFRIGRNLLIDHMRGHGRRSALTQELEALYDITDETPQVDECLANEEQMELLEAGLRDLPLQCREVFELSRNEGLSHREIADRQGMSLRTVARQMALAIRFLRERVER